MEKRQKYFIKTTLKSTVEISAVYTIHYFKYGKNFNFKEESHPFWELIYIDSGTATIVADQKRFSLKQGQAFLHKPNERHTVYTTDAFANSAIISFESKSRSLFMLTDRVLEFEEEQKNMLNKIIHEAKISYSDKLNDLNLVKMSKKEIVPFGSDQVIKNYAELIMVLLLREQTMGTDKKTSTIKKEHSAFVQNVINIMNEKLSNSQGVSLDEIAKSTGYSKSYLKTKFKAETGQSVVNYFIELKMEKAKILISHGKHSVSEIADQLGFNSVNYFCRQFKMNTDMSPTEYLHSIKTENLL